MVFNIQGGEVGVYSLNKIVGFISNPVTVAMLLGVAAIVLKVLKRERWMRILCVVAFVWLWFWMTPLAGRLLGPALERDFLIDGKVPKVEAFPAADAIVLLGGSMSIETNISEYAEMWTNADRVWQAARLYKAGKAPLVVATSPNVRESTGGLLVDFGIPKESLKFFEEPRNTEEEARLIAKTEYKRILLVTSAWHMRRAHSMFKKYAPNIEVICAPADFEFTLGGVHPLSLSHFLPNSNALGPNSVVFHEWVGIIGYKLFR